MKNLILFVSIFLFVFLGCKKEKDDVTDSSNNNSQYVLKIENGAQTIEPNESLAYSALLIDKDGSVSYPNGVSWSISADSVGTINASGILTPTGMGNATISASVSVDGITYSASVPIGVFTSTLFAVAPSAIIYEKGGTIQLETVCFTTGQQPTYTYSTSNSSVATVSGSGLVSFVGTGECIINVTASTLPNNPVQVPVLVIDAPDVALPITRIELDKSAVDLFKNETAQFSATAYNDNGAVNGTTFSWKTLDPDIASVNSSGLVTPLKTGKTYLQVSANGIFAQAEILVNPDTVIIVSPYYKDMTQGQTFQFTATAYKNERNVSLATAQTYPVTFNWMIPDFGPGFEMFNVGTIDNNGNVTIKPDAIIGMTSFVIAYDQNNPNVMGGAMITIGFGF